MNSNTSAIVAITLDDLAAMTGGSSSRSTASDYWAACTAGGSAGGLLGSFLGGPAGTAIGSVVGCAVGVGLQSL